VEQDFGSSEGLAIYLSVFVLLHFIVVVFAHSLVGFGSVPSKLACCIEAGCAGMVWARVLTNLLSHATFLNCLAAILLSGHYPG
jgi:hypothetical protein